MSAKNDVNYELMNSYVMSKNVLQPDLKMAVQDPVSFFLVKQMLTTPVVTTFDADNGQMLIDHFNKPNTDVSIITPTADAVRAIMSTVNTADVNNTTISSIFSRVQIMCISLMDMQLSKGFGTGFRVDSLITYVRNQLMIMLGEAEKQIPFKLSPSNASPVSLQTHLDNIRKIMDNYVATKIQADMRTWLFTDALTNVFYSCMRPYFLLKYIGTMLPGSWNTAGNLTNVSFYDSRYAELVMYRMVMALYTSLATGTIDASLSSAVSDAGASTKYRATAITAAQLTETLGQMRDGYKNTMQLKMTSMQDALLQTHGGVAMLSNATKIMSVGLNNVNDDLEFRKQTLKSLAQAVAPMKATMQRSQKGLYAWITAYVCILIISALLMSTERYNTFFIMAMLTLLIVMLYVLVRMIMVFVRNITSR